MWIRSKAHLAETGETYLDHLRFAAGVGLMLVAAGLACIIHGLLPALCTKTASRTVDELKRLFAERDAFASALAESSGALVFVGLVALTLPSWALLLLAPGCRPSTALRLASATQLCGGSRRASRRGMRLCPGTNR